MNTMHKALRAVALGVAYVTVSAGTASAQAWEYPSFQQPRTVRREYNFALADGDAGGTALLFQWREGYGVNGQLSLDVGYADSDALDGAFFLGGQYGHQLIHSGGDTPIDLLLTVGANAAFADNARLFRVPVGASLGRRFPLEGGLAITPYVHPRATIDFWDADNVDGDSEVNINFDLGGSFEFSRSLALRLSATLGGGDDSFGEAFGISLAYTPLRARSR